MGARDPARARAPRAARRGPDETVACARVSSGSRPGRRTAPADDERPGRNGRSSARFVRLARRARRRPRRSRHPRRPGPDADAPTRAGVSTHAVIPGRSDTPASGPDGCVDSCRSYRDESTHPPRARPGVSTHAGHAGMSRHTRRDPGRASPAGAGPRGRGGTRPTRGRECARGRGPRRAPDEPRSHPLTSGRSDHPAARRHRRPRGASRPDQTGRGPDHPPQATAHARRRPGPPAAGRRPRPPTARTTRRRPPPTPADGPDQPRARPRAAPTRSSPPTSHRATPRSVAFATLAAPVVRCPRKRPSVRTGERDGSRALGEARARRRRPAPGSRASPPALPPGRRRRRELRSHGHLGAAAAAAAGRPAHPLRR